jgi:hypothetical protein
MHILALETVRCAFSRLNSMGAPVKAIATELGVERNFVSPVRPVSCLHLVWRGYSEVPLVKRIPRDLISPAVLHRRKKDEAHGEEPLTTGVETVICRAPIGKVTGPEEGLKV